MGWTWTYGSIEQSTMQEVKLRELSSESVAVNFRPPETTDLIPPEERETLLAIDGVEGFGMSAIRQLCVYVRDRSVCSRLPKRIGTFEVVTQVVGIVRAQHSSAAGHQSAQARTSVP